MNEQNSNQINKTSYYALPCGRQLESYMWMRAMTGPEWSMVKYLYRAGQKDGESGEKDRAKAEHFARFLAERTMHSADKWMEFAAHEVESARKWDGVKIVTGSFGGRFYDSTALAR